MSTISSQFTLLHTITSLEKQKNKAIKLENELKKDTHLKNAHIERYTAALNAIIQGSEEQPNYTYSENQKLYTNWSRLHDKQAFLFRPDLTEKLIEKHLHHAFEYYGLPIRYNDATKSIEIVYKGQYRDASVVLKKLSDKNKEDNYTVVPEKGLVKRQITNWKELTPLGKLTKNQVDYIQKKAALFNEIDMPNKNYVLEIVSSWTSAKPNCVTSGYAETIQEPRHPWVRLITPEGDLYIVGYGWSKPLTPITVAQTISGAVRSPDVWETMPHLARPITRIPIDEQQFSDIKKFIESCSSNPTAFNTLNHNCTKFVAHILHIAAIHPKLEVSLGSFIQRLLPIQLQVFLKKSSRIVSPILKSIQWISYLCIPPIIKIPFLFITKKIVTIFHNTVLLIIGGAQAIFGEERISSLKEHCIHYFKKACRKKPLEKIAMINSLHSFLKKNHFMIVLPKLLIEWQMQQKSTSVYSRLHGFKGHYTETSLEPICKD